MRGQCKPGAIAEALVNSGGVPPAASDFRRAGGRALRIHEEGYPPARSCRAGALPNAGNPNLGLPCCDKQAPPWDPACPAGAGRGSGGGGRHAPPATDESPVPVSVTGVSREESLQTPGTCCRTLALLLDTDPVKSRRIRCGTSTSQRPPI